MNRYLAFLNNYDIRPCRAQYLWWFYYLQDHLPNTYFIINKDYLNVDKNRWEYAQYEKAPYKYNNPSTFSLKHYTIMDRFEDSPELKNEIIPSRILKRAMTEPLPSVVNTIKEVLEQEDITASISWCNNASVEVACELYNIPTIHNESGALRTPFFIDTCYFDLSGVNGNTEFNKRFENFKKVTNNVEVFSRKELLSMVSQPHFRDYIKDLSKVNPQYECGVAMQVDVDTNVLAFNKGISEADVIRIAAQNHNHSLLIRNHPLSSIGYIRPASLGLGKVDESKNSLEFISKCKHLYTLNSSVAFEAMLMGRKATILGDNPFYNLQFMDENELVLALNFAVFSYLMPTTRLYNEEYYNMRIRCKEEEYLYNEGKKYWLEHEIK